MENAAKENAQKPPASFSIRSTSKRFKEKNTGKNMIRFFTTCFIRISLK
jgi:hypothetical protein